MDSAKLNLWVDALKAHSDCLNFTSIIWFWMNVEETDDWESIEAELKQLKLKQVRCFVPPLFADLSPLIGSAEERALFEDAQQSVKWYDTFLDDMAAYLPNFKGIDEDYEMYRLNLLGDEYEFPEDTGSKYGIQSKENMHTFISAENLLAKLKGDRRAYPDELNRLINDEPTENERLHLDTMNIWALIKKYNVQIQLNTGYQSDLIVPDDPDETLLQNNKGGECASPQARQLPDLEEAILDTTNPFRPYKLMPVFKIFIWNSDLRNALTAQYGSWASTQMKEVLSSIFGLSGAKANSLRIITQDYLERSQSSGKDLQPLIKPLCKLFWDSGESSYLLNEMLPKKRETFIVETLGINVTEYKAIKLVIEPNATIPGSNLEVSCRVRGSPKKVIDFVRQLIAKQGLERELFELDAQERKCYDMLLVEINKVK